VQLALVVFRVFLFGFSGSMMYWQYDTTAFSYYCRNSVFQPSPTCEPFRPLSLRLAAGLGEPDLALTWGRLDPDLPSSAPDLR
ncbi:hypothetical protein, partial [Photorhabdus tasmaniensis]